MKIMRLEVLVGAVATFVAATLSVAQAPNGPPDYIRTVDGERDPESIPLHEAAWTVFGMLQNMAENRPLGSMTSRTGISEEAISTLVARIDMAFVDFDALTRRHTAESCDSYARNAVTTPADFAALSKRQSEEADEWRASRVAEVVAGLDAATVAALQARFDEVRRNMKWGTLDYDKLAASPGFDLTRAYAGMCDTESVEQ